MSKKRRNKDAKRPNEGHDRIHGPKRAEKDIGIRKSKMDEGVERWNANKRNEVERSRKRKRVKKMIGGDETTVRGKVNVKRG